jgi:RNA-directed DNA polymerase
MKRLAVTLEQIAARENLTLAVFKATEGRRGQADVRCFLAGLDCELDALRAEILDHRSPRGHDRRFVIHDPKRRTITAPCLADRVLHHAVFNLAEPRLEAALTSAAYACRPGLGVHAAVGAVQRGLRAWPWVVQVDVRSYFAHIEHSVLRALLAGRFKGAAFLALLERIVAGGGNGRGLPIGALTSQHFANAYLDSGDRLLMAHAGVGAVVRYMDDIVWFCTDRAVAAASLAALRAHLGDELRLELKDRVVLRPSEKGLVFCGYRIRQGVVLAGRRKLRRYGQACSRMAMAEAAGVPDWLLQRMHDVSTAALLPAQTLATRRRRWWPLHDGRHL